MFEPTSRYYPLATATLTVTRPDGTRVEIRYVRRRIIPPADGDTVLVEHTVTEQERLDHITARYLDDPTQFWRVCDANVVLRPDELERVGRTIRLVMPKV
jgi:hypothetical protein